jgi:hypothetical protein
MIKSDGNFSTTNCTSLCPKANEVVEGSEVSKVGFVKLFKT